MPTPQPCVMGCVRSAMSVYFFGTMAPPPRRYSKYQLAAASGVAAMFPQVQPLRQFVPVMSKKWSVSSAAWWYHAYWCTTPGYCRQLLAGSLGNVMRPAYCGRSAGGITSNWRRASQEVAFRCQATISPSSSKPGLE